MTASLLHLSSNVPLLASSAVSAVDVDFDLTMLAQMVAFGILIIVLKPLLFDPLLKVFEERERRTDGAKLLARRMDQEAGELLKRYDAELTKVRKVAGEERERLRNEGQSVESRIMAEARAEVAKILGEGRARMRAESERLRAELRGQVPALARELASRSLGREVG